MTTEKSQKNILYPPVKIRHVFLAFWNGVKKDKLWFFVLFFSMIFLNVIHVIIPLLYKKFFDVISSGADRLVTGKSLVAIITEVAILNAIVWVAFRIITYANNVYQPNTIARLKQQAFDYLMNHSFGYFSNNFTGSLVQRVNRFARAFERLSDRLLYNVTPLAVQIVSIIIIVSAIEPMISVILSVWVLLMLAINISFARWKFKYDVKVAEIDSKTTGYLADTITNHNTIQLFTRLPSESAGFRNVTFEQAKMTRFTWNLDAVLEACQAFLIFLIEFLLFYYAIRYWQNGLITVGVFVLLQVYLIEISGKLWDFTRVARDVYQGYADAKEMVEIMLLPHEIKDLPHAKKLTVKNGEIRFENLNFSFNKNRQVLKNINIAIKPGEKIALIGPSGAGKTTFVRLILRLYSPTSGKIMIDGEDITAVTQESLRDNISLVPQDPVLFHRTLMENIGYGNKSATAENIVEAGKLAHCDEFIAGLPYGYDTYVGERGIKLSGGERQRVAIARAILKNAPILILDEATSSLDSHSEALIQDALDTLMKGRTTIAIAHRLSTIQKMDRIIVVDNGQIVEEGGHSELLAKDNSLYKRLWSLQAGGFLRDNSIKENGEEKEQEDDSE
ncbi:MAG TPA: ABC transporter ATP-binding protein [Candidatus Paceibacterota bacterium]